MPPLEKETGILSRLNRSTAIAKGIVATFLLVLVVLTAQASWTVAKSAWLNAPGAHVEQPVMNPAPEPDTEPDTQIGNPDLL